MSLYVSDYVIPIENISYIERINNNLIRIYLKQRSDNGDSFITFPISSYQNLQHIKEEINEIYANARKPCFSFKPDHDDSD